ncbi:MAG TPA: PAS domain-containing sensor histidine kinase [Oscillatoriales cyanobacterium M59_W2019_021]|nr:PAS domain-containing sensor histidine kinase [Oscillatoriales cyanobacterium M59_W2019_021]
MPVALNGGDRLEDVEEPERSSLEAGDNCPEFVVLLDVKGKIGYVSPAVKVVLGYLPEIAIGKRAIDFVKSEDRERCAIHLQQALENSAAIEPSPTYRVRDSRGCWCKIEVTCTSLATTLGGGLALACRLDLSHRQQAEELLREERDFIAAVLEMAGALVLVLDRQGRIVRFNRACESLTQYSFEEVKGKCVWDLFLIPQEIAAVREVFDRLLSSQRAIEYENYWQAKDGARYLISWSNTVLRDRSGNVKYTIAAGLDVTEHQRLEEMRCALQKEKELNQLQSRFFTMASHQFRTPLTTILLSAHALERSVENASISKRLANIDRIQSAARSLTQTLSDILTISRAETGHLEFDPHPLDLDIFCRDILSKTRQEAGKNHRLTLTVRGEVYGVAIDENLLRRTIENLLANAIQYSPEGSEISLCLQGNARGVKLSIGDRGLGIPRSDLSHVFNAFYRGSNVEDIPGVGLGLTVVKKCVELHGGKISLSSEEGMGTTVTVKIPKSARIAKN